MWNARSSTNRVFVVGPLTIGNVVINGMVGG